MTAVLITFAVKLVLLIVHGIGMLPYDVILPTGIG
ncbi:MAG: hypothetical protein QOI11_3578 [Candidatus Eremiobacteraeota bacterium]|jgi:hypothetical protein|nr:hypothetical protein [Candidatus Eremiobacteraeota bacterium]